MTQPQASGEKPKAFVYGAEGTKTVAFSPIGQNNCFLCSLEIGEADPRQFYTPQGATGIMLAHTGCLYKFQAAGEVWPPPEPKQVAEPPSEPRVDDLGDVRRVVYGNARVVFGPHRLALPCEDLIAEKGLKAVIPDLIVALRAVEAAL